MFEIGNYRLVQFNTEEIAIGMAFREKYENCFNEKSVKNNFTGIAYKLAQKIGNVQKCSHLKIFTLNG